MATVACKLPNGLVVEHRGLTLLLNGSDDASAVKGYGLTPLTDKTGEGERNADWFNDWATGDGKDFPAVARGLIFLAPDDKFAAAQAGDLDVRSGLEGVDPEKPGEGIDTATAKIEMTDEQKAALPKAKNEAGAKANL